MAAPTPLPATKAPPAEAPAPAPAPAPKAPPAEAPAPAPAPAPKAPPAEAPAPAPKAAAPKPTPTGQAALGKKTGSETGGRILPKEELDPSVLEFLKVISFTHLDNIYLFVPQSTLTFFFFHFLIISFRFVLSHY